MTEDTNAYEKIKEMLYKHYDKIIDISSRLVDKGNNLDSECYNIYIEWFDYYDTNDPFSCIDILDAKDSEWIKEIEQQFLNKTDKGYFKLYTSLFRRFCSILDYDIFSSFFNNYQYAYDLAELLVDEDEILSPDLFIKALNYQFLILMSYIEEKLIVNNYKYKRAIYKPEIKKRSISKKSKYFNSSLNKNQLNLLHDGLVKEGFITPMILKDFLKFFNGGEVGMDDSRIKWHKDKSQLFFFLNLLMDSNYLDEPKNYYNQITNTFQYPNGKNFNNLRQSHYAFRTITLNPRDTSSLTKIVMSLKDK